MSDNKETFGKRLKKAFDIKLIAIIVLACSQIGGYVFDLASTGADVKFNDKVVTIIKGDVSKRFIDSLIHDAIDIEMNDPYALLDILSSEHVNSFAETKAKEVKEQVRKEMFKSDSLKSDMIHELGSSSGIRNDKVMDDLGKLLKAFKEGKLYVSRTVRANF